MLNVLGQINLQYNTMLGKLLTPIRKDHSVPGFSVSIYTLTYTTRVKAA
jgi:hypothetical protein